MTRPPKHDPLEAFFAEARQVPDALPDGLYARIIEDAQTVQSACQAAPKRLSWAALVGGWPSFAGLTAAAVAGVVIGVVQPGAVGDLALLQGQNTVAYELGDLLPVYADLGFGDEG